MAKKNHDLQDVYLDIRSKGRGVPNYPVCSPCPYCSGEGLRNMDKAVEALKKQITLITASWLQLIREEHQRFS